METTGRGSQCRPRAANVAYASASSSGLTEATPRVNDGTISVAGSSRPIPIALASR